MPMFFAGIRPLAVAAALVCALSGLTVAAHAADGLGGSWAGTGTVELPSGAVEKARCRATFRKAGGSRYSMNAVCATSSARVAQEASLSATGVNRYAGQFFNSEYGIEGRITLTVNGDSLSASLHGGGGSARFHLSR